MTLKLLSAALVSVSCMVGAAQAATLNIDLTVTADSTGLFLGSVGTATLDFADSDAGAGVNLVAVSTPTIIPGLPPLPGPPQFDITSFNMFGASYGDSDDPNSILEFDVSGMPSIWRFAITDPASTKNSQILDFATIGDLRMTGQNQYAVDVSVTSVPLPATALLLGTTLLGAGGLMRARRNKS